MRTNILLAVAALLLTASCSYSQQQPAAAASEQSMKHPGVIELFTSEGCSSCPAADALMPKLQEQYGDRLIILSFHVDYWDRLGWKDAFSRPEWTRRQNQYAAALGNDQIYTPQAVVNGSAHITGSNREGVQRLIGNGLNTSRQIDLAVVQGQGAGSISINYKAALEPGEVILIALVQRHATTQVRRGENGGRQLQHFNVVRDLKTAVTGSGTERFALPDGLPPADFHVIAYVQHSGTMHITAAKEITIR